MRVTLILAVFALLGAANFATANPLAEKCLECHGSDADYSLAGEGADNIAEWAKEVRAGEVRHPPGLDNLTDEQIAELAEILNEGS
ncbi:MAG: c-type cytochrome [Gammaproteobacteria bacterium]